MTKLNDETIECTTPTKEDTISYCTRPSKDDFKSQQELATQTGLVEVGKLIESIKYEEKPEFIQLKTMTIEDLNTYVEKKLLKDHYSPEMIYLLFQIQSLVLERENKLNTYKLLDNQITEIKKELIREKTENSDTRDILRETTSELEETEKTKEKEINCITTQFNTINLKYEIIKKRNRIYEKTLIYLISWTIISISLFINSVINRFSW
jgi:hypothetical protein